MRIVDLHDRHAFVAQQFQLRRKIGTQSRTNASRVG